MSRAENNIDYYVVEFTSGAASTFTTGIEFNNKYQHVWARVQTMGSVCTIYPQVGITNASGSYFRVALPQNTSEGSIQTSVSQILTADTGVVGTHFIDLGNLGQIPCLRFECVSLPTDAVQVHVFAAHPER